MWHRHYSLVLMLVFSTAMTGQDGQPPRKSTIGVYSPQGTVTELSKQFITIQVPGEAAKRFVVSDTLAAGKTPSERRPRPIAPYPLATADKYRLTDVNIGDRVQVIYAVMNGVEVCDHIRIIQRPGGLVPPLPEDAGEQDRLRYHERMNAYWNLKDNGIAYPAHFGPSRRFPEAPMPHEVKR